MNGTGGWELLKKNFSEEQIELSILWKEDKSLDGLGLKEFECYRDRRFLQYFACLESNFGEKRREKVMAKLVGNQI